MELSSNRIQQLSKQKGSPKWEVSLQLVMRKPTDCPKKLPVSRKPEVSY